MRLHSFAIRISTGVLAIGLMSTLSCPAIASETPIGISCQFADSAEYDNRVTGRIVIEIFNLTQTELRNVLVRFAPETDSEVIGEMRRATHLPPGGARILSGRFSLPAGLLLDQSSLVWEVRYQDGNDQIMEVTSEICEF